MRCQWCKCIESCGDAVFYYCNNPESAKYQEYIVSLHLDGCEDGEAWMDEEGAKE